MNILELLHCADVLLVQCLLFIAPSLPSHQLTEMGFTAITAQGLSAPPYFLAFLLVILTTYIADRTQQRGLVMIVTSLIGATGYIVLATISATGPRYTGVFLAAAGIFPAIVNLLPWTLNNQGSDTKRGAGITILNLIGQCGPLLGTRSMSF